MTKHYYECDSCSYKWKVGENKPTLSVIEKCPKCGKIAYLQRGE